MGSLRFPGFGERLTAALVAAGYVKRSGEADIPAFLAEHDYDPRSFYPWVRGRRVPELDTLTELAGILGVTRAWLLLGDGKPPTPRRRSAEGSRNAGTQPVVARADAIPLLGRRLRDWWGWLDGSPTWSPA